MLADRPGACAEDYADLIVRFTLCDPVRTSVSRGVRPNEPSGFSAGISLVFVFIFLFLFVWGFLFCLGVAIPIASLTIRFWPFTVCAEDTHLWRMSSNKLPTLFSIYFLAC